MIVSACLDKNMLSGTTWKTPDRLLYISIVVNAGKWKGMKTLIKCLAP